jgi:hypothetical protein
MTRKPKHAGANASASAPDRLREWIAANRQAPPEWRTIAGHLADDLDMARVWDALGHENAMRVFSAAQQALASAVALAARMSAKEERKALLRVKKAAQELKEAIEHSPLPRWNARLTDLTGAEDEPPVPLWIAWRSAPAIAYGYSLEITELMDSVAEAIDSHIASLPPRAVQRARSDARWPAFARWLNWLLIERDISPTVTQLTIIMNAALARYDDPFTDEQVKAFLRDSPEAFKRHKKRDNTR